MRFFAVDNNWTDTGWIVGFSLGLMSLHWSHIITAVFTIFLTFLMAKKGKRDANQGAHE